MGEDGIPQGARGEGKVSSASDKSALLSRSSENTAALVAFVTRGQISSPRGLSRKKVTNGEINREGSFDAIAW